MSAPPNCNSRHQVTTPRNQEEIMPVEEAQMHQQPASSHHNHCLEFLSLALQPLPSPPASFWSRSMTADYTNRNFQVPSTFIFSNGLRPSRREVVWNALNEASVIADQLESVLICGQLEGSQKQ